MTSARGIRGVGGTPPAAPPTYQRWEFAREATSAREAAREFAAELALPRPTVADIRLAVGELAGNTVRHTDGPGVLELWLEHGTVVVQTSDQGHLQPDAGRQQPSPGAPAGRGLWLVRQLADEVQIEPTDAGTRVRLRFAVPVPTSPPSSPPSSLPEKTDRSAGALRAAGPQNDRDRSRDGS